MDQQAEKEKTGRVTGLGRGTREEITKWNQMTALRFQTGVRHQTSMACPWGQRSRVSGYDNSLPLSFIYNCVTTGVDSRYYFHVVCHVNMKLVGILYNLVP